MNWLEIIVAILATVAVLKALEYSGPAARWLYANRGKAAGLFSLRIHVGYFLAIGLLFCVLLVAPRGCSLPSMPGIPSWVAPKVTAVTYVHDEKAVIPSGVSSALNELNAQGIVATQFPDDAADGDDDVPDQYKVTLPAAKAVGIPCLVVQAGDRVLRTVKSPTTKAQVLEAAQ